jgi:hypothetical protein
VVYEDNIVIVRPSGVMNGEANERINPADKSGVWSS